MAAGPGYNDAQGVYLFGEDDTETLLSELLNRGQESISQQFGVDRDRLDELESQDVTALTLPSGYTGNARLVKAGRTRTLSVTGLTKTSVGNWGSSLILFTLAEAPLFEVVGSVWASDQSFVPSPRIATSGNVAFYAATKPNTVTFNLSATWGR